MGGRRRLMLEISPNVNPSGMAWPGPDALVSVGISTHGSSRDERILSFVDEVLVEFALPVGEWRDSYLDKRP
jgi:hypothetical protein